MATRMLIVLVAEVDPATLGIHCGAVSYYRPVFLVGPEDQTGAPLVHRTNTSLTHQVYGYMPYWTDQGYLHLDLFSVIGLLDITFEPNEWVLSHSGFPGTFRATIERAHRRDLFWLSDSRWHQGWYDDDSSLMLNYQELREHGFWALGSEYWV